MPDTTIPAAKAIELKPGKYYMIMFDLDSIDHKGIAGIAKKLYADGIRGVCVAMRDTDGVTVIEADEGKLDQLEPAAATV